MDYINKSTYDRLLPGMSYADVTHVLGCDGELLSAHQAQIEPGIPVDAMETEVYEWKSTNGGSIRVMFGHGALREKSEEGLS